MTTNSKRWLGQALIFAVSVPMFAVAIVLGVIAWRAVGVSPLAQQLVIPMLLLVVAGSVVARLGKGLRAAS